MRPEGKIRRLLQQVYGETVADQFFPKTWARLEEFRRRHPELSDRSSGLPRVTEKDAILITYGDMVQTGGQHPLQTLARFLRQWVVDSISTVHLLPFFPYSSDDGFAVIDYYQVNPDFGDWGDIAALGDHFRLMFDAVINHISAQSEWFQSFLTGEYKYQDYFFVPPPDFDTSNVFRPRALPLLTPVETAEGEKRVWTTFSEDQIDLNYRSPELLLEVMDVLLDYVARGAEFIRLDAIAFIWKESGTSCIHLPETHALVQLMRAVFDHVAPGVSIITETNVPHEENISYFGDGYNEAQMVYNFSLPPLTLHAFHTGDANVLSSWARTLSQPSDQTTFFNFMASHDGVGLMPARGYLPEDEIREMADRVQALGGYVSYKDNPDGSQTAYELNINYLDALGDPDQAEEPVSLVAQRFLASQAIMLALRGVPGIYFHSLFGSRSWFAGVEETGRKRTINRQKLARETLEVELTDPDSLRHQVFNGFRHMLAIRNSDPAFHPQGGQEILSIDKSIFALLRTSPGGDEQVLCLHNVSEREISLIIDLKNLPLKITDDLIDRVSGKSFSARSGNLEITISPYQVFWGKPNLGLWASP